MLLIIPQYSSLVNEEESSCFLPVLLPRSVFFPELLTMANRSGMTRLHVTFRQTQPLCLLMCKRCLPALVNVFVVSAAVRTN